MSLQLVGAERQGHSKEDGMQLLFLSLLAALAG